MMTEAETALFDKLGECAGEFHALETIHPSDEPEFIIAIHAAQNIVLSRPALKAYNS